MIRKPTDLNRLPCLLLCLEGVTMGSRPAERPLTLKQQVSDVQRGSDLGLTHACTLNWKSCILPFYNCNILCVCVCALGDDMEHEQDTVLQLQEVIEQLRNVFPSEPGEFFLSCAGLSSHGTHVSETDSLFLCHPRESKRWRGVQICTAVGR